MEKRVKLKFNRADLVYDIGNYAYVEGHIMPEAAEESRHMTKDIVEDGNIDRANRLLSLYHAKATEILYPLTKRSTNASDVTDTMETPEVYEIELAVPEGFSDTTLKLLELLVHEYLVCGVMADWLAITNPSKAEAWAARAAEAEFQINTAKNARQGIVLRKTFPF